MQRITLLSYPAFTDEGVSGSAQGQVSPSTALSVSALSRHNSQEGSHSPPDHSSFSRSALTLFLQQKAVFTPSTPIWPSAINLSACSCITLCDNSLC